MAVEVTKEKLLQKLDNAENLVAIIIESRGEKTQFLHRGKNIHPAKRYFENLYWGEEKGVCCLEEYLDENFDDNLEFVGDIPASDDKKSSFITENCRIVNFYEFDNLLGEVIYCKRAKGVEINER